MLLLEILVTIKYYLFLIIKNIFLNFFIKLIGHFDNEIDTAGLKAWEGIKRLEIKD